MPAVRFGSPVPASTPSAPNAAAPHGKDPKTLRLLSGLRLKVTLTLFITVLLVALSGLIFLLVSRIFAELTPSMRAELEWKTRRGAKELAQAVDFAVVVADEALIKTACAPYIQGPDVVAIVVTDADNKVLSVHGKAPEPVPMLFAGAAGDIRQGDGYLVSWAQSQIEGRVVGNLALVISTAKLVAGENLRNNILGAAGLGCVAALLLSLFFVNFYLGPIISLTHRALRTARELEIAKRIQTSILPQRLSVDGMQISAAMVPAEEVGGDYYDVVPTQGGAWIGVGDVAGHGLKAGLIMLMVQSVVAALTRQRARMSPKEAIEILNRVLFDNIRERLGSDEHVTFTLMRYESDGNIVFAGAHEEILVWRARDKKCEVIPTPGTWMGAVANVSRAIIDSTLKLERGDLMVLYTDGLIEAQTAEGKQFGLDRVIEMVEANGNEAPDVVVQKVVQACIEWAPVQDDDITILALRYQGV
ncbi:MAG: PP2C family protein-serine/threonine phosphatase [Deltaproteobacteria bacterium]|nr:PP2C family protein-serine/threonine phosphatase [Deltaproteobacteria bacterium]